MKPFHVQLRLLPIHLAAVACVYVAGLVPSAAQTIAGGELRVQPMSRFEAEQARLRSQLEQGPPTYIDRVMDDTPPGAGDAENSSAAEAPEGVRAWLLESRAGWGRSAATGSGTSRGAEAGIRAEYRRETLNLGDWSLQFDGRAYRGDPEASLYGAGTLGMSSEPSGGRFTLRVLGLPLTPRRFADVTVGDFHAERTDGLLRHDRLAFGTTPLRGASVRLIDDGGEWRMGSGQRGWMVGGPYPAFERSQGSRSWLGTTRKLDGDLFAALQVEQASDVPAYYTDRLTGQGTGSKDVRSMAASVGRNPWPLREGDLRLRATLVASSVGTRTAGVAQGSAAGLFGEGAVRLGGVRHSFSAYAAQPNLHFGDALLWTGTRGGHWRIDSSSARLSWGAGVDADRSPLDPTRAGADRSRWAYTANAQYVAARDTLLGGNIQATRVRSLSEADPSGVGLAGASDPALTQRSMAATVFAQTRFANLPRSRLALTVQRNRYVAAQSDAATGQELSWEQDWFDARNAGRAMQLTTTLGYARDEGRAVTQRYPTAGVQFRQSLGGTLDLQGSLRYTSRSSNLSASRGLSGSVSLDKALAAGWRIGAMLSLNQARSALVPAAFDAPQVYRSNDKSVYLYVRWQGQAGQAYAPLGERGPGGAGSGDIEGRVFLDADGDGLPGAGERGARGVEVVLDGRYRTTTDGDGRFAFPTVAVGRHQISVATESVPLPWSDAGAAQAVDVPLRGTAHLRIPLAREAP